LLEIINSFELKDVVRSVAFTPDGSILAAAGGNGEDFSIHLWDVPSGQSLGTLDGHSGIVWAIAFSPDGQLLASVSADQTAKIWDWRTKTLIKSLDFPGQVCSVSFSPDGQSLAIGGVDTIQNQIQNAAVWTFVVGSWQSLMKYPEFVNVVAMAYSPKGGTLLGGGTSANVQVWRTSDGARTFTLNHAHQVSKMAISPDGSTVATATCITVVNYECKEGGIWLWDLPSGKLNRKLTGFPDAVQGLAFAADGSTLVAGSRDGTLRFFSTADYSTLTDLASPGGIDALALSPDGGLLATGTSSGQVHIWKNVYRP
jgi:WD40 repeat protein